MDICAIKPQSTLDSAISAIGSYILDNKLSVGMVLPSEAYLSKELGISRNILREAMQHYRTLGIINSKPRIGSTIIRLLPENPYHYYQPFLAAQKLKIEPDLIEARFILEPGAARFIIKNITEKELDALESLCRKLDSSKNYQELCHWDTQFHIKLLEATHNLILIGMIQLFIVFFDQMLHSYLHTELDSATLNRISVEHQTIIEALKERDVKKLRHALECPLKQYLK